MEPSVRLSLLFGASALVSLAGCCIATFIPWVAPAGGFFATILISVAGFFATGILISVLLGLRRWRCLLSGLIFLIPAAVIPLALVAPQGMSHISVPVLLSFLLVFGIPFALAGFLLGSLADTKLRKASTVGFGGGGAAGGVLFILGVSLGGMVGVLGLVTAYLLPFVLAGYLIGEEQGKLERPPERLHFETLGLSQPRHENSVDEP